MVTLEEIKSANTKWALTILDRRLDPKERNYKKKAKLISMKRKKV